MAASFRKFFKSKHASSSSSSTTINSREIMSKITSFDQEISRNNLPPVDLQNIYKIGKFDFKTAYSIKDHEETLSLNQEFEEIKLLSSLALDEFRKKGFNYIHFGLIQVAIKPLSRTGIDSPILMLLRDKTLLKFEDSLLGAVQSNLCNGAVYFNCAPNYQVSLNDPTILNTLVLNVHLPETKFQNERHGYLLLYRIYFKHSTSEFNPRCLLQDNKGETTILAVHSNDTPTATYTPKQLNWNAITIPDQWKIEITQPPRNFEQRNISKIVEQRDGKILLQFGSYREPPPPRISPFQSRASFSEFRTKHSSADSETESVNQTIPQENQIRFEAPIASPQKTYPTSPTQSDFNSINVILKEYEINKEYIREDFYSQKNETKRNWYFKTFSKAQTTEIREKWYDSMQSKQTDIPFFLWFETYSAINNIDYPYQTINANSSLYQNWELTNGMIIKSIHPPLKELKIETHNRQIIAIPFKTGANKEDKNPVTIEDIKAVFQQNNYQSQILHTISKQVDYIDTQLSNQEKHKLEVQHPFTSISPPIFKPVDRKINFPEDKILQSIAARLENIDKAKTINMIDENDNESIQTSIQSDSDNQEINRIKNRTTRPNRPYYKRHSQPNMLLEEHHKYSHNIYTGNGIHEWNLDGRSEYEIMKLLQEMGMAALAYKATNDSFTEKQTCIMLTAGFTGALKYWWDNSIDRITQDSIINHVETIRKEDNDGFIIETEEENGVEVLIHTIMMHFLGNPAEELESKKIILTNLRCPTLGDFKWYKDVFIANIFQRKDCNQSFWKERFIAGLPSFFAERVISKLKECSGGQPIPWNSITYGQLFAFIKKEGLTICKEQKDKKRNDKFKFRITMGSFCEQYGYEKFNPPSRVKRLKHRHSNPRHFRQNNFRRNDHSNKTPK